MFNYLTFTFDVGLKDCLPWLVQHKITSIITRGLGKVYYPQSQVPRQRKVFCGLSVLITILRTKTVFKVC